MIRGGGGGKVSKKIFSAVRASVWSKNKGDAGPPALPLDPSLLFCVWGRGGGGGGGEFQPSFPRNLVKAKGGKM